MKVSHFNSTLKITCLHVVRVLLAELVFGAGVVVVVATVGGVVVVVVICLTVQFWTGT